MISDFDFLQVEPAWSKKAVDRLGESFAKGTNSPEEADQILDWYGSLAANTATAAENFAQKFWEADGMQVLLIVGNRAKSKSTIADKRNRDKIKLSKMWDFAGARLTANVLHSDLRMLAEALTEHLESEGVQVRQRDYLATPQRGYRALHLLISSKAGLVELQLRTLLQSEWANVYEKLADKTGRRIRYEDGYIPRSPDLAKVTNHLQTLSEDIYGMEMKQEIIFSQNKKIYQTLGNVFYGLPIAPMVHQNKAQVFEYLRQSELAAAKQASATLDFMQSLRSLKDAIEEFDAEKEE